MILADASVWVDHLHRADAVLSDRLKRGKLLMHPYVLGEIALGTLRNRSSVIESLQLLPVTPVADPDEVLLLISRHGLDGTGIGYVDAHLVAATLLIDGCSLWTRDRRLKAVATSLGVANDIPN